MSSMDKGRTLVFVVLLSGWSTLPATAQCPPAPTSGIDVQVTSGSSGLSATASPGKKNYIPGATVTWCVKNNTAAAVTIAVAHFNGRIGEAFDPLLVAVPAAVSVPPNGATNTMTAQVTPSLRQHGRVPAHTTYDYNIYEVPSSGPPSQIGAAQIEVP